ncbi:MAG: hypothetical protein ACI4DP_03335 [Candidatus Ornithomonoglobus sp.]
MGRQIYFTKQEIESLREASTQWYEILGSTSKGIYIAEELMDNGLGSALYKLYKGCNGERMYEEYARRRNQNV